MIIFDKTGTLTRCAPALVGVVSAPGVDEHVVLALGAIAMSDSTIVVAANAQLPRGAAPRARWQPAGRSRSRDASMAIGRRPSGNPPGREIQRMASILAHKGAWSP